VCPCKISCLLWIFVSSPPISYPSSLFSDWYFIVRIHCLKHFSVLDNVSPKRCTNRELQVRQPAELTCRPVMFSVFVPLAREIACSLNIRSILWYNKYKLRVLSPPANYTDRATAACRRCSANFCGYRVPRDQRDGSLRPYSRISRPEPLLIFIL
jgi:hypothetical protein